MSCVFDRPACFLNAFLMLSVHTDFFEMPCRMIVKVIRSVLVSHRFSSSGLALPSSAKVSVLSFMGSPRCDLTFTKNVARPTSIFARSNSRISRSMSASGASASVARPPLPYPRFDYFHCQLRASISTSSTHCSAARFQICTVHTVGRDAR